MKEYQQRHLIRTIFYSKVTMVVLFVVTVLLLRSIVELNEKRVGVAKLHQESLIERTNLEDKVMKAKAKNEAIETPRGFDTYVRTTYPVVANGEGVIVVYDAENSLVTPVRETITIWERLLLMWNRIFTR